MTTCQFCGQMVDVTGIYYVRVQGWERPGRGLHGRSGSSLVLRDKVPDALAHAECIARAQAHLDDGQLTL